MTRLSVLLGGVAIVAGVLGVSHVRNELNQTAPASGVVVDIPRGTGARDVVDLLAERNLIRDRYVALLYVAYTRSYNKLKAGEYLFDRQMTIPEVVGKLTSGDVYLHKFTVPEGLTVKATAQKWEEQGFGPAEEFLQAASGSLDLVQKLDPKATSLEGFLFPETYSFPSRTTARQAITSMVDRFRQMIDRVKQVVPESNWPRNLHDTIIVASLIEAEAAHTDERPIIASVYLNRLGRNILLQCDPTVIYALDRENRYRGTLTLADLRYDSPYNTYVRPGLPPGPISNPGYPSLLAAALPASTNYIFFVRTVDGRHTFSETLAAHNRAVAAYRRLIRTAKRNPPG
jgi:UPF0755 protein